MRNLMACTAIFLSCGLCSLTAQAGGDLLSLGIGGTNVFHNRTATDFRGEYRWGDPFFWQIKPLAGVETSSRGGTDILAGVLLDLAVQPHVYITPSFAPGLYFHGDGKDLGSVVEFRSQLEASYEFDSLDRFSLAVSHTSNAGIDKHNPGTEAVTFYYHFPLNRFFGDHDDTSGAAPASSFSHSGSEPSYSPPPDAKAATYPNDASPMPAATPIPY